MYESDALDPSLSRRAVLSLTATCAVAACAPEIVTAGVDGATGDAAQPDVAQPDAAQPDAAQPDAAQPDAAQPDAAQPDVAVMCPPANTTLLGPISMFPVGRWASVTTARVIVGRDSHGIFAYSNVCPHRSCAVPAPASPTSTSRCPCHGAVFTSDGGLVSGPTTSSLVNYLVIVCNGNVYLNRNRTVPMGTRTPVP